MYLYFMICGFLFVMGSSIVLTYLFELVSINSFTKFLSPIEDTPFNRISISVISNLIWAFIEIGLLGSNKLFVLGFILNIFITLSTMYVIKYGYELVSNKESDVLKVVSIVISCLLGFICNYLCLLIGINKNIPTIASFLIILGFTAVYIIIRLYPPKSEFFKGAQE